MKFRTTILATAALLMPVAGDAMTLEMPGAATRLVHRAESHASYGLPVSAWSRDGMTRLATEGRLTQQAWKINGTELTTLQILESLRLQLVGAGFSVLFECMSDACGGFDFRYETEVIPEPDMHVDLGDFRFLSAQRTQAGEPDYVSLIISRSANTGFVQQMYIGPASTIAPDFTVSSKSAPALPPGPALTLADSLESNGHFILDDLLFQTGSSRLDDRDFKTLASLAAYLAAYPERKVALVGHTDAEGGLNSNVALSRKRANAVLRRLVDDYGVVRAQLSAQGMGFLAPRASNLTNDGRMKNRRVEVILTSVD